MNQVLQLEKDYEFVEALELLLDYAAEHPDDFWLVAVLVIASIAFDWAKLLFAVIVVLVLTRRRPDARDKKESKMIKEIFKR